MTHGAKESPGSTRPCGAGWWLRNHLTLARPYRPRPLAPRRRLLQRLDAAGRNRFAALEARYDLRPWWQLLDPVAAHEALWALDLMDRFMPPATGRGLEVGAKNGALLPALSAWSGSGWDAVEIDAHRRYLDLTTRRSRGEAMARALNDSRYIAGDLLDIGGDYGTIVWILPFLGIEPLRLWGLPRYHFHPARLLRHAAGLLAPGGAMLVVNQSSAEARVQGRLAERLGLALVPLGPVDSLVSPYRARRFAWCLRQ